MSTPEPTPAGASGTPESFLETARRIAARIVQGAQPVESGVTWTIMSPDRERPQDRVAVPAQASGTLYEGTSGIALFLAELYGVTGDASLLPAIDGGIRFALDEGAGLPDTSFGFHGGRVGIAYAAARIGVVLGRPELVREAEALLRPTAGKEPHDRGIDVIGGAAGAIPALLAMAEWVEDRELVVGIARRLGDNLLATAERDGDGWAWGALRSSSVRNLCGYAHGAAGVAHGLLELFHATGDGGYLYGAEQAMVYERAFYDPASLNWPDLRHSELGEYMFSGRMDQLRQRILDGEPLAPQGMRYMSAWCHGAPGIGLSRVRAWQVLGDPLYREEALAACRNTEASIGDARLNYSLCHGQGGNAETLMVAAAALGDPALLEPARAAAVAGHETYEAHGRPWPCGTMGAVSDPGLLLGEAGIGYFFLRLARPEVPSVLLVTPPAAPAAAPRAVEGEGWAEWQRRTVGEHFGRTLRLFAALGEDADALVPVRPFGAAPTRSDVAAAFDALSARVAAEADPARRELLEDAFRADRERYELSRSITDFTREFLDALVRRPEDEVPWQEARVGLSPRTRVVHSQHDWDAWAEREEAGAAPPEPEDVFHLLVATGNRVGSRRLSPFAALVLGSLETPSTLDEVVARVEEAVSAGPERREWLEDRVVEQLRQAYRAGFVSAETGLVTADAA